MSRSRQAAKPATNSGRGSKPAPTAWKDRLEAEDWDDLKHTFEIFDEDNSGTIDPEEISKALEELGLGRRNPFILKLITSLQEKKKAIRFEDFIDIIASQVGETRTRDGMRRIFAIYDKDENGVIDFEEFKAIAKEIKDGINDDDILEMMHSTHVNQKTSTNEGFTFEEFYNIVSKFNNK